MSSELALRAAKDRIARAMIGNDTGIDRRIGELVMRPHQRSAVARLLALLGRYRGALLADAVGLGKTYVALAVAREYRTPLVICPAALRGMWGQTMATGAVSYPLQSIEGLGRGERFDLEPDLIVIDEAHHFRNPRTRRYEMIARWSQGARILLLSATPLQNRRRDLVNVLALFLGSGVDGWSDEELSRVIVRRTEGAMEQPLPALNGPKSLDPGDDEAFLDAICALPLAVPAADEGTAAALATMSLAHLWSSSRAALIESLRIRRARAVAMKDALAVGHLPSKEELTRWHFAEGAQQLPFPFFDEVPAPDATRAELSERLDRYVEAVGEIIAMAHVIDDPDQRRVRLLRDLRTAHPGERIVAFSQYARTVTAIERLIRRDGGTAVIHGKTANIAIGSTSRVEILEQFGLDPRLVHEAERIDLLFTTDLMSEGVDLRAASVIVHLDLPWNPARLEQRVGRARRMGSPHRVIHVYSFAPPAPADRMLRLRDRLIAKAKIARDLLGSALMPVATDTDDNSPVSWGELLRARLSSWLDPAARLDSDAPSVATASGERGGWLALVMMRGIPALIHRRRDGIGDDPREAMALIAEIGSACDRDEAQLRRARSELDGWLIARESIAELNPECAYPAAKRAVLDRLSLIIARAPRHHRSRVLSAAARVRAGITALDGAGTERMLAELACAPTDDATWLQSLETFERLQPPRPDSSPSRLEALILILPREHDAAVSELSVAAAVQP